MQETSNRIAVGTFFAALFATLSAGIISPWAPFLFALLGAWFGLSCVWPAYQWLKTLVVTPALQMTTLRVLASVVFASINLFWCYKGWILSKVSILIQLTDGTLLQNMTCGIVAFSAVMAIMLNALYNDKWSEQFRAADQAFFTDKGKVVYFIRELWNLFSNQLASFILIMGLAIRFTIGQLVFAVMFLMTAIAMGIVKGLHWLFVKNEVAFCFVVSLLVTGPAVWIAEPWDMDRVHFAGFCLMVSFFTAFIARLISEIARAMFAPTSRLADVVELPLKVKINHFKVGMDHDYDTGADRIEGIRGAMQWGKPDPASLHEVVAEAA